MIKRAANFERRLPEFELTAEHRDRPLGRRPEPTHHDREDPADLADPQLKS